MSDVSSVLRQLPTFPDGDLEKIRLRVSALLSGKGRSKVRDKAPPHDPAVRSNHLAHDYLLEGMFGELRRRGLMRSTEFIPPSHLPAAYEEKSTRVMQLLEARIPTHMRGAEKTALGMVCARALADYLTAGPNAPPLSPTRLIQCVEHVPTALEASFPGYLEAGLLPLAWHSSSH